jgi:hypothetical protein
MLIEINTVLCLDIGGMLVLQSCTVPVTVEHGLPGKTSLQSSDDGNEIVCIKIVGEVVHIKEEDEPIAISFSSVKEEPGVSPQTFQQYRGLPSVIVPFCLSAFRHKSAPYGEWKWSVHIYSVWQIQGLNEN